MKRWDSPILDTIVLAAMLTFIAVSGWLRWTRYSRNHSIAKQEVDWRAALPPRSTNDITINITNTGDANFDLSRYEPTNQWWSASSNLPISRLDPGGPVTYRNNGLEYSTVTLHSIHWGWGKPTNGNWFASGTSNFMFKGDVPANVISGVPRDELADTNSVHIVKRHQDWSSLEVSKPPIHHANKR